MAQLIEKSWNKGVSTGMVLDFVMSKEFVVSGDYLKRGEDGTYERCGVIDATAMALKPSTSTGLVEIARFSTE